MARIITSDEQLRAHIPNFISAVRTETPLFEKLSVFLELAENWVRTTFCSDTTYNTICGYTNSNATKTLTARLVVADAMLRAIPSLDIVLTPNGFGIVSSQNLAPASKQRVDRLVGSMMTHRDECIAALLPELVGASKWLISSQAEFFGATLFPTLAVCDELGGVSGSRWDKYLELRSRIIDLEDSVADEYVSPELMDNLRSENLRCTLTTARAELVRMIRSQILKYLRDGSFISRRLADMVNFIRLRPSDFPEWEGSATAELFSPPVFRNQKESSGYFF